MVGMLLGINSRSSCTTTRGRGFFFAILLLYYLSWAKVLEKWRVVWASNTYEYITYVLLSNFFTKKFFYRNCEFEFANLEFLVTC